MLYIGSLGYTLLLQFGDCPENIASLPPARNAPLILDSITDEDKRVYYLVVKQRVICQAQTFTMALFLWFSFFCIFHLRYDSHLYELCMFFQEFIFGVPCTSKRSSTYLSVATDIQGLALH